jgi:hypothetical protein
MIELTHDQAKLLEQRDSPATVLNPTTQENFVLVRKDAYDRMQKWMAPLKRRWDNPADDDLIRKP